MHERARRVSCFHADTYRAIATKRRNEQRVADLHVLEFVRPLLRNRHKRGTNALEIRPRRALKYFVSGHSDTQKIGKELVQRGVVPDPLVERVLLIHVDII